MYRGLLRATIIFQLHVQKLARLYRNNIADAITHKCTMHHMFSNEVDMFRTCSYVYYFAHPCTERFKNH